MKAVVVILEILSVHIREVVDNLVEEEADVVVAADVAVGVVDNYYNTEVVEDNLD